MTHSDAIQSVVRAYRPVQDEVDVALPAEQGRVPDGLEGILFRNGAGRLEVHGTKQLHPFDGEGMVSRFALGPGGVRYRNRYVETRERREEAEAGAMLYRAFGTQVPGGPAKNLFRTRFKNAANTSVVLHEGRLLALWEAGQPHALDSASLATFGRYDFDGALHNPFPASLLNRERPFSAHPKICAATGELHNFGLFFAPGPRLFVYRSQGSGLDAKSIPLPRPSFLHDFALSGRYAVFFACPITFAVARVLLGFSTPVEAIRSDPSAKTLVVVVPRDGGPARVLEAPSGFFVFHFFGAYDDGDRLVVDGCRMPEFVGGTVDVTDADAVRAAPFPAGFPTRWTIDLPSGRIEEERLDGPGLELPTIDPRRVALPYTVGWATARGGDVPVYTGLAKVDFSSGSTLVRDLGADLPGEPLFVPRHPGAAEGDGFLLSVVYRAEADTSELWILDAGSLETVARYRLPHPQPPGFHGFFVPA